jgi:hypothetical protein
VVVNQELLRPPIHCLGFQAGGRRGDKLHFVPGKADGVFPIRPLNIWYKCGLISSGEDLVRLVDRPGTKIAGERARRLTILRCWCVHTDIAGRVEFGTARASCNLSVSPTGIKDQDASRISTKVLMLSAVRLRVFV